MFDKLQEVHLLKLNEYDADKIYEALPRQLFSIISPGDTVVLKPNWVLEEHQYQPRRMGTNNYSPSRYNCCIANGS